MFHGQGGERSGNIVIADNFFLFTNYFSRGQTDTVSVSPKRMGSIGANTTPKRIELWRTNSGYSPDWFVEKIVVKHQGADYVFPIYRWISTTERYNFVHLDTTLTQFEGFPEQRQKELEVKRQEYSFKQDDNYVSCLAVSRDEQFDQDYE